MGLTDTIAIVTGAAQGIGRSIADRFTKRRHPIASGAYARQNASSTRLMMDEMDEDAVASERQEVFPSRPHLLSSNNSDTRDDLKASPGESEYFREQDHIVWQPIMAILVIGVITFYLLWNKVTP